MYRLQETRGDFRVVWGNSSEGNFQVTKTICLVSGRLDHTTRATISCAWVSGSVHQVPESGTDSVLLQNIRGKVTDLCVALRLKSYCWEGYLITLQKGMERTTIVGQYTTECYVRIDGNAILQIKRAHSFLHRGSGDKTCCSVGSFNHGASGCLSVQQQPL